MALPLQLIKFGLLQVPLGFGRVWATAALERGDKVAATARNLSDIADLQER